MLDVRPRLPPADVPNLRGRDAVARCNLGADLRGCAYFEHIGFGELARPLLRTSVVNSAAEPMNISDVLFLRAPSKVARIDARRVAAVSVERNVIGRVWSRATIQRQSNMRCVEGAVADRECPVSTAAARSRPLPTTARVLGHLLPVVRLVDQVKLGPLHAEKLAHIRA